MSSAGLGWSRAREPSITTLAGLFPRGSSFPASPAVILPRIHTRSAENKMYKTPTAFHLLFFFPLLVRSEPPSPAPASCPPGSMWVDAQSPAPARQNGFGFLNVSL